MGRDAEQTSSGTGDHWQDGGAGERRLRGKRAVGSEGLARDLDLAPERGPPLGNRHSQLSLTIRGLPQAWGLMETWAASRQQLLAGGGRSICLRLWHLRLRTPAMVLGLS